MTKVLQFLASVSFPNGAKWRLEGNFVLSDLQNWGDF